MVLLGGLEIVAAGYLLNELNDNRIKERERKKRRQNRPSSSSHSSDDERPSSSHHRPSSRPHGQPNQSSQSLAPPSQHPPRPSSAPAVSPISNYNQQQWRPQQSQGPAPQQYPNQWQQQFPPQQYPPQPQPQHYNQPPPPYNQQPQYPPQHPQHPQQLQRPSPGLQHQNSFPMQSQQLGPPPGYPGFQQSNTFPQQNPSSVRPPSGPPPQVSVQPPPSGPLMYYNTKTGKWGHNLYPADHPMARGGVDDSNSDSDEGNNRRSFERERPSRSRRDDDGLAYGKDHSGRSRSSSARY